MIIHKSLEQKKAARKDPCRPLFNSELKTLNSELNIEKAAEAASPIYFFVSAGVTE
jgi:hypothetical protein